MKHKELKVLSKRLERIMWGLCVAYWVCIFHPIPPIVYLIILGIWVLVIGLNIGLLVADRKIYSAITSGEVIGNIYENPELLK